MDSLKIFHKSNNWELGSERGSLMKTVSFHIYKLLS